MTTVFTGRNRPHEVMIMAWSATIGVLHFAVEPSPTSVDRLYPDWLTAVWYVLLGLGGAVGLAGLVWRQVVPTLYLERASMSAVGAGAGMYAIAIFYVGGWRAMVGGGLIACWSLASMWRVGQITLDLRSIARGAR